ncbi:MAG: hypothetical protein ACUVSU_16305 [Aggregatilineaceae bacterium]
MPDGVQQGGPDALRRQNPVEPDDLLGVAAGAIEQQPDPFLAGPGYSGRATG